jgi:hypothetical protein
VGGLYNSATGQRLPVNNADFAELAFIEVVAPLEPLPRAAFDIQTPLDADLGGVTLLGYDFYKLGHRSQPEMPLHPGDPVELVTYWQQGVGGSAANEMTVRVVTEDGTPSGDLLTAVLASPDYPPQVWQPGEIVRGQVTFFLSGLSPGGYQLEFAVQTETARGEPFTVEQ